jgi:flagellar biosynthetic protein FlhB
VEGDRRVLASGDDGVDVGLALTTLNPMSGLQRMFSSRSLVELLKSVLKFTIIGVITYSLIKANLGELLLVLNLPPGGIYQAITGFIITVAWWGALAYLALSLLDYMYQRYDYKKSLKMSKQEVKEEFRQTEGDPQIKSRQREMRRRMSLNKIISEVPHATVVVTNPTHLAVALSYRQGEMSAPRVVAKGADRLAERIKEIARENKVPVLENKELARFLYKNVDVDQEIPLDMYQAVAQIIALVYRLKAKENYRAI